MFLLRARQTRRDTPKRKLKRFIIYAVRIERYAGSRLYALLCQADPAATEIYTGQIAVVTVFAFCLIHLRVN